MKWCLFPLACLGLFPGIVNAQTRHNLELGGGGIFPLTGWKAEEYSAGPGLRAGYELRVTRHWAAEAGWTSSWLPGTECSKFGCTHPREDLRLLDYGLRAVVPLAAGRVELSAGLGGGYVWYDRGFDNSFLNGGLLQYSGRASVAMDRRKRLRLGFSLRTWRDLDRLAATGSLIYGFGGPALR